MSVRQFTAERDDGPDNFPFHKRLERTGAKRLPACEGPKRRPLSRACWAARSDVSVRS